MAGQAEPTLRHAATVFWTEDAPWFGGFSGAEISRDGGHITVISDKGSLVQAALLRENGTLSAIETERQTRLKYASGDDLEGKRTDAEGLATDATGHAFISFEHDHRVAKLDLKTGRTTRLAGPESFTGFQPNSGLEALAIHPDGTIFTLPERSGGRNTPFPLFALKGQSWTVSHNIPRRGPFLPVGADFDADGLFYLLERAATPLGFRSRVRRFDLKAQNLGEETLITTGPGRFDNLEALTVWRDGAGQTILTLVSDDNFLPIQRTQIVEFIVKE